MSWTGFITSPLQTDGFKLFSARKITQPGQDVFVYIEGDGHAWISRSQPSTNPTPVDNLVRRLAQRDSHANVAYLARPCQYIGTMTAPCAPEFWLEQRFAPPVIASMDQALDHIKAQAQAAQLHLIGYSGGGAVAVLLAARRSDIAEITTIAGNLDTALYTELHHISPMTGSLNPRDVAAQLGSIPQTHYVGGQDDNVPPAIAQSYISALPVGHHAVIKIIPNATHATGWDNLSLTSPSP